MPPSAMTLPCLLILATLTAFASGCGSPEAQGLFSSGASSTPPVADDGAALVPPDVLKIPQFPVPPNAQVVIGDTVIIGNDEDWSGQVFLSAPYTVIQITQYYRTEMPKVGWIETSIVRSRRTSISYTRGNRVATLRLAPQRDDNKSTDIDLVISPIQTAATLNQRPALATGIGGGAAGTGQQRQRQHP